MLPSSSLRQGRHAVAGPVLAPLANERMDTTCPLLDCILRGSLNSSLYLPQTYAPRHRESMNDQLLTKVFTLLSPALLDRIYDDCLETPHIVLLSPPPRMSTHSSSASQPSYALVLLSYYLSRSCTMLSVCTMFTWYSQDSPSRKV